MFTGGVGLIVTTTVCVAVQPPAPVPVKVYVSVVAGFAVTTLPVVALKPIAGLHVYVVAPVAVNPTEPPEQNVVGPDGVIVTVGLVFTVIGTKAESEQEPLAPTTVYVTVEPGLAVGFEQLVQLKPPAGFHEYVAAPLALKGIPVPAEHIEEEGGVTVTFKVPATVTTTVVLPEHAPVTPVTE